MAIKTPRCRGFDSTAVSAVFMAAKPKVPTRISRCLPRIDAPRGTGLPQWAARPRKTARSRRRRIGALKAVAAMRHGCESFEGCHRRNQSISVVDFRATHSSSLGQDRLVTEKRRYRAFGFVYAGVWTRA